MLRHGVGYTCVGCLSILSSLNSHMESLPCPHTHTHTHSLSLTLPPSLSLSLSLTHTHTHTSAQTCTHELGELLVYMFICTQQSEGINRI